MSLGCESDYVCGVIQGKIYSPNPAPGSTGKRTLDCWVRGLLTFTAGVMVGG